ncbi:MAG: hypothetical protein AB7U93_07885, partial [Deferribacterales bacterium]
MKKIIILTTIALSLLLVGCGGGGGGSDGGSESDVSINIGDQYTPLPDTRVLTWDDNSSFDGTYVIREYNEAYDAGFDFDFGDVDETFAYIRIITDTNTLVLSGYTIDGGEYNSLTEAWTLERNVDTGRIEIDPYSFPYPYANSTSIGIIDDSHIRVYVEHINDNDDYYYD